MEQLLIPLLLLFGVSLSGVKIDREYERGVIFRLGRLSNIKGPGLYSYQNGRYRTPGDRHRRQRHHSSQCGALLSNH
jgi:regulator of protease activity HflC (stomatin/prohibitin superfamily)